ncbi:MAG TPA: phosphoribosylamine--glycine ligase [Terriglobales bacterium]|nr:phosphoribosylamine--glycine ligase [Terriglobales bacterium]
MSGRRILVVGSGGREHALAWRLARDPEVAEVLVAPGREGMQDVARRLPVGERDDAALIEACSRERVDLVVIGPEAPLAAGLADRLRAAGHATYGPGADAARLESSKWFAKGVMREAGIPTAAAEACELLPDARHALDRFGPPWVVKADGLAAGKGVRVTDDRGEAERFLEDCLERGRFGAAGGRVVVEEHLAGEEASLMAVCDGRDFLLLPPARDYKRAFDGDRGPNSGGMGAYAPSERVDAALEDEVARRVVRPALAALDARGVLFRGTLYCGLVLTSAGPKVLEFNVRFGDPETEVVVPLVEGAFARLLESAARGRLDAGTVRRAAGAAVTVALVDEGYPEAVRGGGRIMGLDRLREREGIEVFHAATRAGPEGWEVTGGRAAYVTARGGSREEARARAYAALAELSGAGWRARRDIAAAADRAPVRAAGSGDAGGGTHG